jgi:hypothetical protein
LKTPSSILELLARRGGLGTIPKGRSIAHNIRQSEQAVFLSFDIETAGEIAGLELSRYLQKLSVSTSIRQRRRFVLTMPGTNYERKTPSTGTLTWRFVQNTGISTVYLFRHHPRRREDYQCWQHENCLARVSALVLQYCVTSQDGCSRCMERQNMQPEMAVEANSSSLPDNIKYVIDPLRVIEKYKTCPFNKTKSKIEAYEIGVVCKYANNG